MSRAVDDFLKGFDETRFPKDFLDCYELLECLADNFPNETYLVRNKSTDDLEIAKCYLDKSLLSHDSESTLLKSLYHKGLPRFAGEYENDAMLCVVREYIKGIPLNELISESPLSESEALPMIIQLCDILTYLHGQNPPVIHRDIKPQNIIMSKDGTVRLIDFGISRTYNANAKRDTVFYGTQDFAPPEQYGFAQTDNRADIFSLGVVIAYLLTGETETAGAISKLENPRLIRILRKCTAFAPEKRYKSADALKSALFHMDGRFQKSIKKMLVGSVLCIAFLCAGFGIGRYTDFFSNTLEPPVGVIFEEPMIERAVRVQLGKEEDELITREELLTITEVFIFGKDLIAKDEEEINKESQRLFDNNQMAGGSIRSLKDLTMLPNLKNVCLAMQEIMDISPLAELQRLEKVTLKNNPISDISPLGGMVNLVRVSFYATNVSNLSPLASCPRLVEIDVGKSLVGSLTAFQDIRSLERLDLQDTTLDTLSGVEAFPRLRFIQAAVIGDGDLSPLLSLPYLTDVVLGDDMRPAGDKIAPEAEFEIAYR